MRYDLRIQQSISEGQKLVDTCPLCCKCSTQIQQAFIKQNALILFGLLGFGNGNNISLLMPLGCDLQQAYLRTEPDQTFLLGFIFLAFLRLKKKKVTSLQSEGVMCISFHRKYLSQRDAPSFLCLKCLLRILTTYFSRVANFLLVRFFFPLWEVRFYFYNCQSLLFLPRYSGERKRKKKKVQKQ